MPGNNLKTENICMNNYDNSDAIRRMFVVLKYVVMVWL